MEDMMNKIRNFGDVCSSNSEFGLDVKLGNNEEQKIK